MNKLFIALLVFSFNTAMAQNFIKTIDSVNNEPMLVGRVQFSDLQGEASFTWFDENAKQYKPKHKEITYLKERLTDCKIVVLMGTWCGDSHLLVPQLYMLLKAVHFPESQLDIIGVDRNKKALHDVKIAYKLERVPTIIVYKNDKEKGRIIESVHHSLEEDLVAILKQ